MSKVLERTRRRKSYVTTAESEERDEGKKSECNKRLKESPIISPVVLECLLERAWLATCSLLGIPSGRKKWRTTREENGPFEVSSKLRRSLRLSADVIELTRSPVPPFVASSSLTSCPFDGNRNGWGSTGSSFSASWEVIVRKVGACTSNSRPLRSRAVPLNRICQWGTIWWRERPRSKRTLYAEQKREERDRER